MPDEPDTQQMPDDGDEPRPTEPQPQPDEPGQPPRPRLTRSSTDSMIGGVAGGLGKHFGVDPLAIRITFVILTFAGGLGLLAYLACLVLHPHRRPRRRAAAMGPLAARSAPACSPSPRSPSSCPNWLWGPRAGGSC